MEPDSKETEDQTKGTEDSTQIDPASTMTRTQTQPVLNRCRVLLSCCVLLLLFLCGKLLGIQVTSCIIFLRNMITWMWSWTWLIGYWVFLCSCVIILVGIVCKVLGIKTGRYTEPIAVWIKTRIKNRILKTVLGWCLSIVCFALNIPDEVFLFCRDVKRIVIWLLHPWIKRVRGKNRQSRLETAAPALKVPFTFFSITHPCCFSNPFAAIHMLSIVCIYKSYPAEN